MSGGRRGYRSQRRPRTTEPSCRIAPTTTERRAFEAVAAAPAPIDCPGCAGAGRGCGTCGGLGFLGHDEWKAALQRAFVVACGLVLPCDADGAGEAA